jgi:heavy metal sensor kinase
MTLWYSGVLLLSTLLIGVFCFDELHERRERSAKTSKGMEELLVIMVWIGLPALALSIGGGWWLMRKALSPVAALTEATRNVNERNLNQQLPRTYNADELDQLAEVLNGMTARLNDAFTRVREFTLHASHELKTPLTVLCGETEMELRDDSLAASQRERLASRLEELRRLARIVNGLTLLARADAGLIALSLKPVELDELVRDIAGDAQMLGESEGIVVTLQSCEPATIMGDAHRLRQLLLNLADNAIKYNRPSGAVELNLRRDGTQAELSIANTGHGIKPENLARVFDRFYRGDPAHGSAVEGCGLGLSLAQWIVSAHQGMITIDSVPEKLTTVKVQLPIMERHPA